MHMSMVVVPRWLWCGGRWLVRVGDGLRGEIVALLRCCGFCLRHHGVGFVMSGMVDYEGGEGNEV